MDDIKADIAELKSLEVQATRKKVKDFFLIQIRKLESDLEHLKQSMPETAITKSKPTTTESGDQVYNVDIVTYAWDQSDKFFKVYLTNGFPGIQNHPADNIVHKFTDRSMQLQILAFNCRNHNLTISNLFDSIVPDGCQVRVKTDMVVVLLKKANPGKTWAGLSSASKREDKKMPTVDKEKDPNESIMNMMKQMYDDGDDDMKRTIAKAWTESRDKNPGAPSMPGLDM